MNNTKPTNSNRWKLIVTFSVVSSVIVVVVIVVAVIFGRGKKSLSSSSLTPFVPKYNSGVKLTGSGIIGTDPAQGFSVSMSGDGSTAAVGVVFDNNNIGAVLIYIYSNGTWSQQGSKIIPTGHTGTPHIGNSVSLSYDGNTLAFSGPDNTNGGLAWVWIRSNGVWSQQFQTPSLQNYGFGVVALDSNGNTLAVGASDYLTTGGIFVYTRSGTSWSNPTILVGTGQTGQTLQGLTVAISGGGNTIAFSDPSLAKAIWVFQYVNSTWTQVAYITIPHGTLPGISMSLDYTGGTLAATYTNNTVNGFVAIFESSASWGLITSFTPSDLTTPTSLVGVALTPDAKILIYGNAGDTVNQGATWLFKYADSWSQVGTKIVGPGSIGVAGQGNSVAVSTNGKAMISGGDTDNSGIGAVWIFNSS